ncbi:MAG: hypothetical protein KDA78_21190, partial [Planctomycetaceae bacterium]|nr:hypothetical protein [Planctomycetaceae bacterium]
VGRSAVKQLMEEFAAILRGAGETLRSQCGAEAQQILNEALDEADGLLQQLLESMGQSESSE